MNCERGTKRRKAKQITLSTVLWVHPQNPDRKRFPHKGYLVPDRKAKPTSVEKSNRQGWLFDCTELPDIPFSFLPCQPSDRVSLRCGTISSDGLGLMKWSGSFKRLCIRTEYPWGDVLRVWTCISHIQLHRRTILLTRSMVSFGMHRQQQHTDSGHTLVDSPTVLFGSFCIWTAKLSEALPPWGYYSCSLMWDSSRYPSCSSASSPFLASLWLVLLIAISPAFAQSNLGKNTIRCDLFLNRTLKSHYSLTVYSFCSLP